MFRFLPLSIALVGCGLTVPQPNEDLELTTVEAVQMGTVDGTTERAIDALTVTAVSDNGFWVQDGPGAFHGLYVEPASGVDLPATGDVVRLEGTFEDVSVDGQLHTVWTATFAYGETSAEPEVTEVMTDNLDWGSFDGVLVHITDGLVTEASSEGLLVDDVVPVRPELSDISSDLVAGNVIGSLTGVAHLMSDGFAVLPRSATDFADVSQQLMTVAEVRQGLVELGMPVVVTNLVVTGVIDGGFYAQDGQDMHSGIFVQTGVHPEVASGDLVRVRGLYQELFEDEDGSVTAIATTPNKIRVLGEAPPVVPLAIAAGDLSEEYEGMLVQVPGGRVRDAIPDYGSFKLWGDILIDDLFRDHGEFGYGDTFHTITGVVVWSFGRYRLAPRHATDLGGYEAAVPPIPSSLFDVQVGLAPRSIPLEIPNVVITATGGEHAFAQEAGDGLWRGIGLNTLPESVAVGDVVTLTGSAAESFGLTVLDLTDATVTGTDDIAPIVVSTADLTDEYTAESYEGMLIQFAAPEVTGIVSPSWHGEFLVQNGIRVDDFFYDLDPLEGDSWTSLTGIWLFNYGEFKLAPRDAADAVD